MGSRVVKRDQSTGVGEQTRKRKLATGAMRKEKEGTRGTGIWAQRSAPQSCYSAEAEAPGDEQFHSEAAHMGYWRRAEGLGEETAEFRAY